VTTTEWVIFALLVVGITAGLIIFYRGVKRGPW
jgi:hypothetical protein